MTFFINKTAAIRAQIISVHNVNTSNISNSPQDSFNSASVMVIIGLEELVEICKAKNTEAYMVE